MTVYSRAVSASGCSPGRESTIPVEPNELRAAAIACGSRAWPSPEANGRVLSGRRAPSEDRSVPRAGTAYEEATLTTNISVRVPWHDSRWDGTVCSDPVANCHCIDYENIPPEEEHAHGGIGRGAPLHRNRALAPMCG